MLKNTEKKSNCNVLAKTFIKNIYIVLYSAVFIFGINFTSKACSPLTVPILVSQSIVGTNLLLQWNSTTLYKCPDIMVVEIACAGKPYTGLAAYSYTSAVITGVGATYSYPTMTINIAALCPGSNYIFRCKEQNNPAGASSAWTANFSFTTPGVFITPTVNITATPPIITLCPQGASQLSITCVSCCGPPPYNYSWTPAASLNNATICCPIATPTITTIYTLTSTGNQLSCWVATNTVQVTVITTPPTMGVASVNPPSMCAGGTATLSMTSYTGALQWQSGPTAAGPWTNIAGAITGSFVVGPLNTTTFYQGSLVGCGATLLSNVVSVVVNPNPTVTVNSPVICAGQTANITANGAATYVWSAGAVTTGVNTATANPGATTMYTVTGTTAAGCTGTAVATVSVNPLPIPIANNNGPVCTGGALQLTGGGGGTYQWVGPAAFSSAVQSPLLPGIATTNAGLYTVTVTLNGCTAVASTNVVVTTPTAAAMNTGPYCDGATLSLNATAGGGLGYTWSGPGGYTAFIQNPTTANAPPTMSGLYTVTVNLGSCIAMATTSVTVNPLPTPVALSNAPICEGQSLNLTGSGGVSYNWTGPSFSSNAQNPGILVAGLPNAGNFVLTVTDVNGCINSITLPVVINPLPVVAVAGSTVCTNIPITLGATGGNIYSWSGPAGFTSTLQNPTIPNSNISMAGVYNVTVTNGNGCVNTNFTNVTVNPLPVPTAINNGPLCLNQVLNLTATGGLNYSWTGPAGFSSSAQSLTIAANAVNMSGNYQVTAFDNLGCAGIAVTAVIVNPLPNVSVVASNNKGCVPLCMTFTCATSPGATVNWAYGDGASSGGVSSNNCYKTASDYTVTASVTDINGCFNSNTYPVSAYPIPVADFNYAPLRPIEKLDDVVFTDASYGANIAGWNWYFTNNASAQNQSNLQNPTYLYDEQGEYAIVMVVKSDKGCMDTIIKTIIVGEDYGIYVPNSFTPNGDGMNDVFQPKGFGVTKYLLEIFNRWGEKVFSTTDFKQGWDGTIKGINIKDETFIWKINAVNVYGKAYELKGHVTLIK